MILEGSTMKQPSIVNIHQLEVVFPHCYLLFVEHSEAYKKPFVSSHCSIASPVAARRKKHLFSAAGRAEHFVGKNSHSDRIRACLRCLRLTYRVTKSKRMFEMFGSLEFFVVELSTFSQPLASAESPVRKEFHDLVG